MTQFSPLVKKKIQKKLFNNIFKNRKVKYLKNLKKKIHLNPQKIQV